jgi:aspartate beta-hydroxylase
VSHHHLGRVCDAGGDLQGGLKAHEQAVRLSADFLVARLFFGLALDRAGQSHAALIQLAHALKNAQMRGRWVDAQTTPPALRPAIERAVSIVRTGRRAGVARVLEPLANRYGRGELARVDRCVRIYLGEETPVYPDARQKPTFLFFPGLGAQPFQDHSALPWIAALESQTAAIHAELLALLPDSAGRERVFTSEELEQQNLRGIDAPPSWTGYYFYRHGVRREDNCASCPATSRAIDQLPLVRLREHGPEVLYSVFTPGTQLLPHRGVTNTRLVGHLPLLIPDDCALEVGGEVHHWQPGKVVVFDDTYEHGAWNRSQETRVVMIFDVWHPGLTEVERAAVTELVGFLGDFRAEVDAA